jgi:CAAX prenyl protease-like protein
MKKILLATKRPWTWKVFFVLVGMIVPATFVILPYQIHLQNTYSELDGSTSLGWEIYVLNQLINAFLISVLGGIGLVLATRIGLGMPFVEGWVKRESITYRFRNVVAFTWITAVVLVLSSLFLHAVVLDPPLEAMLEEFGITIPEGAHTPPLYGFLASISAAITEETLYRLFGLSLLAWLGGFLLHDSDGRPKELVFWTANILFALGFGVMHLQKVSIMGWPINPLVITYTVVLNAIGGLAFGWLFWTFGLESAMLAHFFADVIMYTLIPFIDMQRGETARYLAIAGVVAVLLAALFWAWRSLTLESHEHRSLTLD